MNILMIGDIVGKPGRKAVKSILPALREEYSIDLVIANSENAAGGFGLTPETADFLFECEIDVLTSGNHIWDQKEIIPYLNSDMPVLRPMNYPQDVPGRGFIQKSDVTIVNLQGRTFMSNIDCPFRTIDRLLSHLNNPLMVVIDFHAEATSEKNALGRYLDGRVSVVAGTHTHVPTADAKILPFGTAYVTDIGMVGPKDSVIGDDADGVISRFLTQLPRRLSVGKGNVLFNSVLIKIENSSGRATAITRIDREVSLNNES